MLSYRKKRSVVRALIYAYFTYRDLSLLKVCRKHNIQITKHFDGPYGGSAYPSEDPDTPHVVEVPGKTHPDCKEYVFWHEVGHTILGPLNIFDTPRIGIQETYRMLSDHSDYWELERLCEGFASAMFLYRRGLSKWPSPNMETFLFADTSSVGYAELVRFSLQRIEQHVVTAERASTNADVRSVREFLAMEERYLYDVALQPLLPTYFPDTHQCPFITYVDERKDSDHNEHHWDKPSWKSIWKLRKPRRTKKRQLTLPL